MVSRAIAHALILSAATGVASVKRTWNFDDEAAGGLPRGFSAEVGAWIITAVGQGKVLAQTAKNPNRSFNIALVDDTHVKDIDISVEMTAVAGEIDQGGGIVWRAKDAKNYYIARYNPLEDNYRVYKLVDGKRTQLENADIKRSDGRHTLRVTMKDDHIECFYDGKKYLDAKDTTFSGPGKIGLWTKADAQTQFDNLMLVGE